mmetsp:Transcript_4688/g.14282  ORF Transcript_4688/g.14282 Transcript_4688/m.14282 type:complete len:635 (+) Transcript_4688:2850-4754(+)
MVLSERRILRMAMEGRDDESLQLARHQGDDPLRTRRRSCLVKLEDRATSVLSWVRDLQRRCFDNESRVELKELSPVIDNQTGFVAQSTSGRTASRWARRISSVILKRVPPVEKIDSPQSSRGSSQDEHNAEGSDSEVEGTEPPDLAVLCMCEASKQVLLGEFVPTREFDSYVIQFGLVVFFSAAFPLAPLLAWIYNIFALRATARRCAGRTHRPPFRRATGIRLWLEVLEFLSTASVVINLLLCGLSSDALRSLFMGIRASSSTYAERFRNKTKIPSTGLTSVSLSERGSDFRDKYAILWLMILVEHLFLSLRWVFGELGGEVPDWVLEGRVGVSALRRVKLLRDAFGFDEGGAMDPTKYVGKMSGSCAEKWLEARRQGDVDDVFQEMKTAPKERRTPRPTSKSNPCDPGSAAHKFFTESWFGGGLSDRLDDKGLPAKLDHVLAKQGAVAKLRAAELAKLVSKPFAPDTADLPTKNPFLATVDEENISQKSSEIEKQKANVISTMSVGFSQTTMPQQAKQDIPVAGAVATLRLRIIELIRPHSFIGHQEARLKGRRVVVELRVGNYQSPASEDNLSDGSGRRNCISRTRASDINHGNEWADEELKIDLENLPEEANFDALSGATGFNCCLLRVA